MVSAAAVLAEHGARRAPRVRHGPRVMALVEIRLLGPVEVWAGHGPVDIGPSRQRSVLAALAVDAGRPVLMDAVIDRVWGQAPPDRVRHALYVYVARIRRVLAEAGAADATTARVARRSGSYVLEADPDRIDAHRFRALADQAGAPRCADSRRAALLREALGLWRGTPLGGLPGEWAAQVREGWRHRHLEAAVLWANTELRLGNADRIVGRLTDLIAEHPLAESLAAVLMRALYVTGRRAQALESYTRTRRRLVSEIGMDPGPELRDIHQAILQGDLDLPTV
jgi:DNA-binding SARP family transcriptional activator